MDPVIQSVETATRVLLGCCVQLALESSHFVDGLAPTGVVWPSGLGHALALTPISSVTKSGALPSGRVLRHGHQRYYDPL